MTSPSPDGARVIALDAERNVLIADRQRQLAETLLSERRSVRRRQLERQRRRARVRRNRVLALLCLGALSTIGWFAAAAGGAQGHHIVTHHQISIESDLASFVVVPGHLVPFSWPKTGQGAVAVLGTGLVASSPAEHPVPIASLTKMMTALVVLGNHPLSGNADGPQLTMTASDVADYVHASQTDESNTPVALGEVLSERQLFEALLLPSADNIADTLAIWDAGSIKKFVTKMNATAQSLGLAHTHYADASGVDPLSESTAADQAVVASHLMANAAVRSIVRLSTVPFPVAGHLFTVNPALGVDGIIGVKSGYTSHAQGCLATAAFRPVGSRSALVVSVSLSQPDGLYGAAQSDETLLDETAKQLIPFTPVQSTEPIGSIGPTDGAVQPLTLGSIPPSIIGWPGLRVDEQVLSVANPTEQHAGSLLLSTSYGPLATAPLMYAPNSASLPSSNSPS